MISRACDRAFDIEGEIGIDLGRDAAGHELRELGAEIDREPLGDPARRASWLRAPEHRLFDKLLIAGIRAALRINVGLVVQSCGLYARSPRYRRYRR